MSLDLFIYLLVIAVGIALVIGLIIRIHGRVKPKDDWKMDV